MKTNEKDIANAILEGINELKENKLNQRKSKQKAAKNNIVKKAEEFLTSYCDLRYNLVRDQPEYRLKGESKYKRMTSYRENSIYRALRHSGLYISKNSFKDIINSNFAEPYDPLVDYINNLPEWDGKDYIQSLANTVTTHAPDFWCFALKKWLTAMIASLIDPRVVNHVVLVFSGEQGSGKTAWFKTLIPEELIDYYFESKIDPQDKDSKILLSEYAIGNMDELSYLNRTDISELKQIITEAEIRVRRPYDKYISILQRRCSLCGTINGEQFLFDTTGARRFAIVSTKSIDYMHKVPINMVWSQAFNLYKNGFRYYFDKEEIEKVNLNNERYQVKTMEEELLLAKFKPVLPSEAKIHYTATDVMQELVRDNSDLKQLMKSTSSVVIGRLLSKHGFHRVKIDRVYKWCIKYADEDDELSKKFVDPNALL